MQTKNKFPEKIISLLKRVYEEIKYKEIITDNGKEFSNKVVKNWLAQNKINQKFSIPYYHESNGRVERANRTIRNALRKEKGPIRAKLPKVLDTYNNMEHRGIGTSPNEAVKEENWEKVRKVQEKYRKEFKEKKLEKFTLEKDVLIKNEFRKNKMDDYFKEKGKIKSQISENVYLVENEDGKLLRKHSCQLKAS